jgi:protoporphyrinogen IX oxidase
MLYLWLKAFHIISVVCWFAGLFYLPRLFVYHAQSEDTISKERFSIMERKLYRGIMGPAMIATLIFGGWLIYLLPQSRHLQPGWLDTRQTDLGRVADRLPPYVRRAGKALCPWRKYPQPCLLSLVQ